MRAVRVKLFYKAKQDDEGLSRNHGGWGVGDRSCGGADWLEAKYFS